MLSRCMRVRTDAARGADLSARDVRKWEHAESRAAVLYAVHGQCRLATPGGVHQLLSVAL